jgi:hypothetical protein
MKLKRQWFEFIPPRLKFSHEVRITNPLNAWRVEPQSATQCHLTFTGIKFTWVSDTQLAMAPGRCYRLITKHSIDASPVLPRVEAIVAWAERKVLTALSIQISDSREG